VWLVEYVELWCPDCGNALFTRICACGYERTLADEFRFIYVLKEPRDPQEAWTARAMEWLNELPLYIRRDLRDEFDAGTFDPFGWYLVRLAEEAAQEEAYY